MLIEFQHYLTFDNIYLWSNFLVLPFWIMLIFIPNSRITQIFVNSIVLPLLFSTAYIYVLYQIILIDESILNIFNLYLGIDSLYALLSNEGFLVIFWLHFLAINLFIASWVSRDVIKYNISRIISLFSLVLIYFFGPVGLVFYWIFRIFYSKKLGLHD